MTAAIAPIRAKPTREVLRVREEDVRSTIALTGSVLFFALLFFTLIFRPDMFEKVAAATSGLIGAIWGYYFGKKSGT